MTDSSINNDEGGENLDEYFKRSLTLTRRHEAGIRPEYIARILSWLEHCNDKHGDVCFSPKESVRLMEDMPLWLIDTHHNCIVPGFSADRYLALSYVWPETRDASTSSTSHTLLLDTTNVAAFQLPGFLESRTLQIPMVIRHTMQLTSLLNVRYLWVDRLCIVQDDQSEEGTLSQIGKMDKIYGGAYLTIIAAATEDTYQKRISSNWPSYTPSGYSYDGLAGMNARYSALAKCHWGTRGWTYQEQILCKRSIAFLEDGYFWDCQSAIWDNVHLRPESDLTILRADMGKRFSTRWWPDFGFYVDLVCPYNGRNFTYPQDAALGIMGVLNALGMSFPGGFIHGLPRLFLDHALLWQPFGTVSRRLDRTDDGVVRSSLPSWSWSGWQGFVDPWSLRSGLSYSRDEDFEKRTGSWRTRSLVEWSYSSGDQTAEPILEPQSLDSHAQKYDKYVTGDQLPQGWTCRKPTLINDPSFVPAFTYENDRRVQFRHPVPLMGSAKNSVMVDSPAYLHCSTTRASLLPAVLLECPKGEAAYSFGPSKVSAFEDVMFQRGPGLETASPILVLQQPNGAFAGLLRLTNNDKIDAGAPCTLFAISTGSANAEDVRRSFEWRILRNGDDDYIVGSEWKKFRYNFKFFGDKGRQAMIVNVGRVFSQKAASHAPLEPEFDEMLAEIRRNRAAQLAKGTKYNLVFLDPPDPVFDLIAKTADKFWSEPDYPKPDANFLCEFYNVLWVERVDGVAYRRACGWVPKHIWEAHSTGPVNLKLG